jgi:hypothetical protein
MSKPTLRMLLANNHPLFYDEHQPLPFYLQAEIQRAVDEAIVRAKRKRQPLLKPKPLHDTIQKLP